MEDFRTLAEIILPSHMLDWCKFVSANVTHDKDKNIIHIYLDENDMKPDCECELRPNGFTRESVLWSRRSQVLPLQTNTHLRLNPHAFAGAPEKRLLSVKSDKMAKEKHPVKSAVSDGW